MDSGNRFVFLQHCLSTRRLADEMYKPAPPRPKKTNIVRSRSGCQSCRNKRKKCDEQKPTCGRCLKLGQVCHSVEAQYQFRLVAPTVKGRGHSTNNNTNNNDNNNQDGLSLLGSTGIIHSLQHSERDIFYWTYWEDNCLPALHPLFYYSSHHAAESHILTNAILALSACNISRFNAEKRSAFSSYMGTLSPSLVHQTRSQLYYNLAIRQFTAIDQINRHNALSTLTVLVLFAYLESSMGNFDGFYCHVKGMTSFLGQFQNIINDSSSMKDLLAAWVQIRFVVWWARAYYSSLEVHQQLPPVLLPKPLGDSFDSFHSRRITVLSILCESHTLNSRAVLRHWNSCDASSGEQQEYNETSTALSQQARRLDEWLSHLPPSERPICMNSDATDISQMDMDDPDATMLFQSHEAALNFSYYILARIMQCTKLIQILQGQELDQLGHACSEEEPWVRLLLRVANGVDLKTSITRNNYTIGFSGLLLAARLRCQSLSLGMEIESWLQRLDEMKPTEEGAFPVYQTLGVVRAINRQKMKQRDVFGITQPVDDAGGTPKFTAYNSQPISALFLHGSCDVSGQLFTECVSVDL